MKIPFCYLILSLGLATQLTAQSLQMDFLTQQRLPQWCAGQLSHHDFESYQVNASMNPFYLEADLNGQGKADIAISILHNTSSEQGILIFHQEDNTHYILGAGHTFRGMTDFNWMDIWNLYPGKSAQKTIFSENYLNRISR